MNKEYDVIIIGAGPAGLSAGLYASRAKLNTLLIEKAGVGGQIVTTTEIENYPGTEKDMTGPVLIDRMKNQCTDFGAKIIHDEVINVVKKGRLFTVSGKKEEYQSKTVIVASGATPKVIGIEGELEFRGLGVSYCATCDAGFFMNLDVVVVGGGDTALKEALHLTKFAKKVSIIHRRNEFRGGRLLEEKVRGNDKINLILDSEVTKIKGDDFVTSIMIKNKITGQEYEHKTDGVFMCVGYKPNSENFSNVAVLDSSGYITTNDKLQSITAGLYIAGDVRKKELRQVVTAVSDGAICAVEAENFIENVFS